jgi:hypothetical protein
VARIRIKYLWNSPAALFNLLVEFADLPMMLKCLLGIKERAEKRDNNDLAHYREAANRPKRKLPKQP